MAGDVDVQAIATVAALQPGDKASLERLGENWSEQLLLEEGFLNAVYHHLQYTLHMIWDHVQKLMEDVADDVEDLQHKYRVSSIASMRPHGQQGYLWRFQQVAGEKAAHSRICTGCHHSALAPSCYHNTIMRMHTRAMRVQSVVIQ